MPSANHAMANHVDGGGNGSIMCVHLQDGTLAEVRNLGGQDAYGDWLCFLDADDELDPGYLVAMAETTRSLIHGREGPQTRVYGSCWGGEPNGSPALLVPAVSFVDDRTTPARLPTTPQIPNGAGGRPLIDINHAVIGTLIPKKLFAEVGGFRDLPALEDWDLWLRCEEAGAKLVPVWEAVYRAHVRHGSRNADQMLYQTLRDEALARRANSKEGETQWGHSSKQQGEP